MSLKYGIPSERRFSSQQIKEEKPGSNEFNKKKGDNDCCSTLANAGDHRRKPLTVKRTKESMFLHRRSIKIEMQSETSFRSGKEHSVNSTTQEPEKSNSTNLEDLVKKEETGGNFRMVVLPSIYPPTSPKSVSKSFKKRKKQISNKIFVNFDTDVLGNGSPLPKASEIIRSSSDAIISTPSSKSLKATTQQAHLIKSNQSKTDNNAAAEGNACAELDRNTTFDVIDSCANGRSIWDLDSESEDIYADESSNKDCRKDDMDFDESKAVESNNSPNKDKLICLDCSDVFETKEAFKVHIASHKGYRRFKCDVCEMRFINSGNLNTHIRIHTGERPFKCDVCEKSFSRRDSCETHKRVHTGERPFKCDVCEKRFSRRDACEIHKRVHTGEKPYKCLTCGKRFSEGGHLQNHKRIHSGEGGHLQNHKRIHSGWYESLRRGLKEKCIITDKS